MEFYEKTDRNIYNDYDYDDDEVMMMMMTMMICGSESFGRLQIWHQLGGV